MAQATAHLLFFLTGALLLCKPHGGDAQRGCMPSDISVSESSRAEWYHGVMGSTVTFETPCSCPMVGVRVACAGITATMEGLDTSLVEVVNGGAECVLKQPVVYGTPYQFDYAVAAPINFRVIDGQAECGYY